MFLCGVKLKFCEKGKIKREVNVFSGGGSFVAENGFFKKKYV